MTVMVRVAIAGAGEVLTAGIESLLHDADDVELVPNARPTDPRAVDVVLYDVIGMQDDGGQELWRIIASGIPVIALGRPLRPDLAARAVAHGAVVTLPTEAPWEDLLVAIKAAAAGEAVRVGLHAVRHPSEPRAEPLTPREVDILAAITRGLSNQQIAMRHHITINTVKSVIRNAYRKIHASNRPQAMAWGIQHGFDPPPDPSTTPRGNR